MRNSGIFLGLLVLGLVFIAGCAKAGSKKSGGIEEPPYTVVEKQGAIELRQYQAQIVAETLVSGSFEDVGNEGFRRLFKYISGDNQAKQSIVMTAPVGQQAAKGEKIAMTAPVGQQAVGDQYSITFMMPASYTMETIPQPTDDKVVIRQIPPQLTAVIRYSGFWSQKQYDAHLAKLQAFIEQKKLTVVGVPNFARYNPPFMPFFMRRNEILIEVQQPLPAASSAVN